MTHGDSRVKHRIGTRVFVTFNMREGVVMAHGRDTGGVYSRVRFDDGTEGDYHREYLVAVKAEGR